MRANASSVALPELAVVLAAGRGSRLLPHTASTPKCLLDLGGETILDVQVRSFVAAGIPRILVVTGYRADLVAHSLASWPQVECLENRAYATTNSLASLALAAASASGRSFVLVNGDVAFHPEVLARLLAAPGDSAVAYDSTSGADEEEMKVEVRAGRLAAIAKDLPSARTSGESLGLLRFGSRAGSLLGDAARRLVAAGAAGAWAPRAYAEILDQEPITAVDVAGLAWIEIDTPDDLARARRKVYPLVRAPLAEELDV